MSDPYKRLGKIEVSLRTLEEALRLPKTTRIVRIHSDLCSQWIPDKIEIFVEDNRLKKVLDGYVVPRVDMICSYKDGCDFLEEYLDPQSDGGQA